MYGKELVLDIHDCDNSKFNRNDITLFFIELCKLIEMERCYLCFWDYVGEPEEYKTAPDHLKGTSAVQFISTSNITIHTLDVLKSVYLNVFSCKEFKVNIAAKFCSDYFDGKIVSLQTILRGEAKDV